MKFIGLLTVLCILAVLPLEAGGGRDGTARGPVANSAAIVTPPGQLPIVREPLTMTVGLQQSPNVNNYETNYLTGWLERQTGIKTNFHLFASVGSDANTQFELMISANERLPDVMLFGGGDWMLHGDNGVFIDLNPYFRDWAYFYNQRIRSLPASEVRRIELHTTAPSGRRYAYAMYSQQVTQDYRSNNFINKAWLDRLGLPIPRTTEEFYNTMVAFRDRDPTGTGQSVIPYIGGFVYAGEPINWIINAFVYHPLRDSNNWFLNVTNGRLWTPWTTEEYREALRYLNRLYREGLMSPSTFTITLGELTSLISYERGEVGRVGFFSAHQNQVTRPETPAIFDFTFQPPLIGPRGVQYYPMMPNRVNPQSFITRDATHPEAAFRWLDYWSEREASMVARFGELGVDWRWTRPEENAISYLNNPSFLEVFNAIWAVPQNKHWQHEPAQMYIEGENTVFSMWTDDGSWLSERFKMYQVFAERAGGLDAPEVVELILYTEAELNDIREMRQTIDSHRQESLALFITGELDIERDWNNYLATLDRMGLPRYLEIAQRAYTRTMGNR